jgi:hypothetical protein
MEHNPNNTIAENASEEAVSAAANAAQTVETARQALAAEAAELAAERTRDVVFEGLRQIFGDGDSKDPQQMKVLVQRIPILCTNIETMHSDIADIKDSIRWGVRLIIGVVITGVLGLLFTTAHGIQLP